MTVEPIKSSCDLVIIHKNDHLFYDIYYNYLIILLLIIFSLELNQTTRRLECERRED